MSAPYIHQFHLIRSDASEAIAIFSDNIIARYTMDEGGNIRFDSVSWNIDVPLNLSAAFARVNRAEMIREYLAQNVN